MDVKYSRDAVKILSKMPKKKAEAILVAMRGVALDPYAHDPTIKPLKGVENGFRKRFGDWRVLYTVDNGIKILNVFKIGPRGDVYK